MLERRGVTRAMPLEGDVGRERRLLFTGVWGERMLSLLESESAPSTEARFLAGDWSGLSSAGSGSVASGEAGEEDKPPVSLDWTGDIVAGICEASSSSWENMTLMAWEGSRCVCIVFRLSEG